MLNIKVFVCNPFQENCYVVSDDTAEGIIIDCGALYAEEHKAITGYVRKEGIRLKHLIATHGHIDHNCGNHNIHETFGLQPEVSFRDRQLMDMLNEQSQTLMQQPLSDACPPVGKYLDEKNIIEFGHHRLTIIPTPGHTPGSVFFYCEEEKIAFSGDTLFRMSIGRTDFWQGSYDDIMRSLRTLPQFIHPDTIILPGHGPRTTMKDEMACNPYLKR